MLQSRTSHLWALLGATLASITASLAGGVLSVASPTASLGASALILMALLPIQALYAAMAVRLVSDQYFPYATTLLTAVVAAIAVVAWLTRRARDEAPRIRRISQAGLLLPAIFVPAAVVAAVNGYGQAAGKELARLVAVALVFAWAFESSRGNAIEALRKIIAAALSTAIALAIMQQATGTRLVLGRPPGPFAHPNVLGLFCVLLLNFSFGIALFRRASRRSAVADAALVVAALVGVGLSRSFSGLFATVVSVIAWAFLLRGKSGSGQRTAFMCAAIGALAIVGPFAVHRLNQERPQSRASFAQIKSLNSVVWREQNWRSLADLGLREPWVGYGLTSSSALNPTVVLDRAGRLVPAGPHNEPLRIFVEGGLLGLALTGSALLQLLRFLQTTRRKASAADAFLLDGVFAAIIAFVAFGLTDNALGATAVLMFAALPVGVLIRHAIDASATGRVR